MNTTFLLLEKCSLLNVTDALDLYVQSSSSLVQALKEVKA